MSNQKFTFTREENTGDVQVIKGRLHNPSTQRVVGGEPHSVDFLLICKEINGLPVNNRNARKRENRDALFFTMRMRGRLVNESQDNTDLTWFVPEDTNVIKGRKFLLGTAGDKNPTVLTLDVNSMSFHTRINQNKGEPLYKVEGTVTDVKVMFEYRKTKPTFALEAPAPTDAAQPAPSQPKAYRKPTYTVKHLDPLKELGMPKVVIYPESMAQEGREHEATTSTFI
jgi:hypothetical protein